MYDALLRRPARLAGTLLHIEPSIRAFDSGLPIGRPPGPLHLGESHLIVPAPARETNRARLIAVLMSLSHHTTRNDHPMQRIRTLDELRDIVGEPSDIVANKIYDHLNRQATAFIARSPFLTMATVDEAGMPTVSPKGDSPGFVQVADASTLYIPERKGNRLVVSYQNILANGTVGLLFVVPRCRESLRVSGHAQLVTDPTLCEQLSARGAPALLALEVKVTEAYFQCGKSLIRSDLWKPDSWPEASSISFGEEIGRQTGQGQDFVESFDNHVAERYEDSL